MADLTNDERLALQRVQMFLNEYVAKPNGYAFVIAQNGKARLTVNDLRAVVRLALMGASNDSA